MSTQPRLPAILLAGTLLSVTALSAVHADPATDRLLASQCAQCHGTNGQAVGDMDGLDEAEFSDLYDKLLDIKRKDDHDIMHFQIQGYTDDQLWRIATYYSGLPKQSEGTEDATSED